MNYGKKNLKKNKASLSNKKAKARKKIGISFVKTLLICIAIIAVVGLGAAAFYVTSLINKLPDVSTIDISPEGFSTTIYDNDGNEIENLASSGANREYVSLEQIPEDLQHAFVAIEDSRFYDHNGIDIQGIIRAVAVDIVNIFSGSQASQGASTITQQLLKNNYFTTWTSETTLKERIDRKIQEQYLAIQLEKVTSKDEILENYLNTINLGQNTLGVQAASERYFNKDVSELTLSEAAVIAGITQNPSKYNPITNPDENAKRRKKVLQNMLDQGYITEAEYNEALEDDVYDRIQIINNEIDTSSTSYFVDALTDQVIDDLMEQKGYTETEAYQKLYSGGLTIYSTQDSDIQSIVEEEINNTDNYATDAKVSFTYRLTITKADGTYENYSEQTMLSYYQSKDSSYSINFNSEEEAQAAIDAYKAELMEEGDTISESGESVIFTLQPQAAMTVMDQSTGYVVALVGGRGDKAGSKTLNRATGITRQPGSTFKVLAAYAPALDAGGLTLASVQDDAPMTYANGTSLSNYDNNYRGFTNIRTAITNSINVVTVKTLTQIGTSLGYDYVEKFGISTLDTGDNNQALALGGITNGVTNLELTAAYATIANSGDYNKPVFYTQVLDYNGDVLLDNTTNTSTEVLKDTTAWLLTNAMEDVMTSGTGTRANISNMAVAGKSGTTTKDRDTVFCGYTPYYTASIWGGYDDNSPQSSTVYSKNIWREVMSRIHENLEYKDFTKPSGIVQVAVCSKSGLLPVDGVCNCDPRGSMVYTEYFAEGTQPTETCDHHVSATICNDSGMIANEYCTNTSTGVYIVGGSQGTADTPYLLTDEFLSQICTTHSKEAAEAAEKEEEEKAKEEKEDSETETEEEDTETSEESSDDSESSDTSSEDSSTEESEDSDLSVEE
ncbi:MAG: PBP1A family penicillin-binding protein [Lachnospiraceae bacterium]|nr:PBP1A family penicillin-binding protein [Lachnospiraceae bacterium]